MAKKKIATRIKDEKARLEVFFKDLPPDKKGVAQGLIERAAWMRVQCEELEVYLINNGWVEPFQQSRDIAPYDRARPQGQTYQTLNANYQKIIKQLEAMLPERLAGSADDGFDKFVQERDGE